MGRKGKEGEGRGRKGKEGEGKGRKGKEKGKERKGKVNQLPFKRIYTKSRSVGSSFYNSLCG